MKMFRIIGRESRITIPWAIRQKAGFRPDDVVSFQLMEDDSVLVRRESTCGKEKNPGRWTGCFYYGISGQSG